MPSREHRKPEAKKGAVQDDSWLPGAQRLLQANKLLGGIIEGEEWPSKAKGFAARLGGHGEAERDVD